MGIKTIEIPLQIVTYLSVITDNKSHLFLKSATVNHKTVNRYDYDCVWTSDIEEAKKFTSVGDDNITDYFIKQPNNLSKRWWFWGIYENRYGRVMVSVSDEWYLFFPDIVPGWISRSQKGQFVTQQFSEEILEFGFKRRGTCKIPHEAEHFL